MFPFAKHFTIKLLSITRHVKVDVFASLLYVIVIIFLWVVVWLWWLVWELEHIRDFSHRALPAARPRLNLTHDQSSTNHSSALRWGFLCFFSSLNLPQWEQGCWKYVGYVGKWHIYIMNEMNGEIFLATNLHPWWKCLNLERELFKLARMVF